MLEGFLQQVQGGAGGAWQIVTNLGLWTIVILGAAVWFLITKVGMKWPGAVATVFFGSLLVFIMSSFLMGKGLRSVGDTNKAYAENCKYANLPCPGDVGYVAPNLGGGGSNAPIYQGPGGQEQGQQGVAAPQTIYRLRANAYELWLAEKMPNLRPNDWLKDATTALLPVGTCHVTGDGVGGKDVEKWTFACAPTGLYSDMAGLVFVTNGYIARDSRSFNANSEDPAGQDVYGTGDWKTCASCWETITPTLAVSASSSAPLETATPPPPGTTYQPGKYLVTDPTGSDSRAPVNNACDALGKSGVVVKKGDTVNITQVWERNGQKAYNGTPARGLTDTGLCLFMGTLTLQP